MLDRHIVIVGEMGAGKTTVGELLAAKLKRPFFDSDRVIEARLQRTGAQVADTKGVEALHHAELSALEEMLASGAPAVIAAAASVVDTSKGRESLESAFVVRLSASDTTLESRQANISHRRSISVSEREELRSRRHPHLGRLADFALDTDNLTPYEIAEKLVQVVEIRQ